VDTQSHVLFSMLNRKDAGHGGGHAVVFLPRKNSWHSVLHVEAHKIEAQARDPLD